MHNKNLCQYLIDLRKSCDYSQKSLASYLNITRQTYSHYETGRIIPPVNALYKLARLYGIPVESFLDFLVDSDEGMVPDQIKQNGNVEAADNIAFFPESVNDSESSKNYKKLSRKEWQMLFYYRLVDERDQNDVLSILKVKYQNSRQDD